MHKLIDQSGRIHLTLVLCGILCCVAPRIARAQDVGRIDQLIQAWASTGRFMGSVLIARGDVTIFSRGYGAANLEWNVPNSPSTRFRIASLTKQFTAASILLLEERGTLRINAQVKTYFPRAPAAWDAITVFSLLTHSSGIPDYTRLPEFRSREPFPATPDEIVSWFLEKPLEFASGERYSYSNSNYVVLGDIIEKLTGRSYAQFVQENIFGPLGMKDSGYDSKQLLPNRAAGYAPRPSGPVNAGFTDMTIPFAAGGLYSTTQDLLRWERGLFGGKLLSPAAIAKMTTPFKHDYAFGLMTFTNKGRRVIFHNGGIQGFNTFLAYYPNDDVTVVVLANLNGRAPDEMGPLLGALAHSDDVRLSSERKEIAVAPSTLARYVGSYELEPGFDLIISVDGPRLMANVAGQPKVPLFAETEKIFFLKSAEAQYEFVTDKNGKATHLILHQGGRDTQASLK
jgi:CubicO group peptidase (beta-lactamase class C family)